jgi:hypothetical protein
MSTDHGGGFQTLMDVWPCEAKKGAFVEIIKDDRFSTEAIVFASVCELKDGVPHHGSARFTVHDVTPGEGEVAVAITSTHPNALKFQVSLYIFDPFASTTR